MCTQVPKNTSRSASNPSIFCAMMLFHPHGILNNAGVITCSKILIEGTSIPDLKSKVSVAGDFLNPLTLYTLVQVEDMSCKSNGRVRPYRRRKC